MLPSHVSNSGPRRLCIDSGRLETFQTSLLGLPDPILILNNRNTLDLLLGICILLIQCLLKEVPDLI